MMMTKGNPLTQRQRKYKLQIFDELVHLIKIFASLRNSIRGLIKWLLVVQVYAITNIAISLGFHIFILLNSFFPHFLSSCNVWMRVFMC